MISVSPRIHLPPLSSRPSASLLSYAPQPPPCRQTQCQHDVGLAQCVGLMGKEKSLNMQKELFNPHFFDSFCVVQHYQLNLLILEISFSDQKKMIIISLLHYIHDFIITVSERRLDFRHLKTSYQSIISFLVCAEFILHRLSSIAHMSDGPSCILVTPACLPQGSL